MFLCTFIETGLTVEINIDIVENVVVVVHFETATEVDMGRAKVDNFEIEVSFIVVVIAHFEGVTWDVDNGNGNELKSNVVVVVHFETATGVDLGRTIWVDSSQIDFGNFEVVVHFNVVNVARFETATWVDSSKVDSSPYVLIKMWVL